MGVVNMFVLYSGNDTEINSKCVAGDVCLSFPVLFTVIYLIVIDLHLASGFDFAYQESPDTKQSERHYDL